MVLEVILALQVKQDLLVILANLANLELQDILVLKEMLELLVALQALLVKLE
jgi:hypothetical protein